MLSRLGVFFPSTSHLSANLTVACGNQRKDLPMLMCWGLQYSSSHICIITVTLRGDNIMKKIILGKILGFPPLFLVRRPRC